MTVLRYAFVLAIVKLSAVAADSAAIAPVSAPPSIGSSVFRMLGGLFIVISLLMTAAWAYRNRERFVGQRVRASKLKVLESRSLGARHSICVIAYEQQRILLSTSPTGVTMLTHLPEATLEEMEAESKTAALPTFSEALMQALASRRK